MCCRGCLVLGTAGIQPRDSPWPPSTAFASAKQHAGRLSEELPSNSGSTQRKCTLRGHLCPTELTEAASQSSPAQPQRMRGRNGGTQPVPVSVPKRRHVCADACTRVSTAEPEAAVYMGKHPEWASARGRTLRIGSVKDGRGLRLERKRRSDPRRPVDGARGHGVQGEKQMPEALSWVPTPPPVVGHVGNRPVCRDKRDTSVSVGPDADKG